MFEKEATENMHVQYLKLKLEIMQQREENSTSIPQVP